MNRTILLVAAAVSSGVGAIISEVYGESIVGTLFLVALVIALAFLNGQLILSTKIKEAKIEEARKQIQRESELAKMRLQKEIADAKTRLVEEVAVKRREMEEKRTALASVVEKYKKESLRFFTERLTTSNFSTTKDKIIKMYDFLERQGFSQDRTEPAQAIESLKASYEDLLRKEAARQEQARMKERIREEARLEAERQRELKKIENEEIAIQEAIRKALQRSKDEHSEEVERLRAKLAEAQAKMERAKSQAQLTKAGHIYVISNIGSFGENVFKIGMTRRLEPMDRVRELGDASVPFPFDVHMMISCEDAPKLESIMHREFNKFRVNRVNLQKEFFRTTIEKISEVVKRFHGTVEYVADPEALQYRESQSMSDKDFEYVAHEMEEFALADSETE